MGVDKSKSRLSEFISRACRLPKEVAGKIGNLSDSIAKERLKAIQNQNHIPYKFLTVSIILLLYLPWMISLTYIIPPQIDVTFGNEITSESYCNVISSSELGVTNAVLVNTTPFSFNGDWKLEQYWYWNEFDYNRYAWNDTDGCHFTSSPNDASNIVLMRRMQIPIANYSELTVSAEFEGISGVAGIYFEVFAEGTSNLKEDVILAGNITTVSVTAPLDIARIRSDSWLSMITCRLQIGFAENSQSHIKLRSIVIDAEFTESLNRVQLDFKNTDNTSLYANPYMRFADYSPRFAIMQNNDSDSLSTYFPIRVDDEIYLPPGTYEGVTYWYLETYDPPHPSNSSQWVPNVTFVVTENTALEIDVGLFTKRLDFDVFPSVIFRGFSLFFVDNYQYIGSTEITGTTIFSQIPDYLYIPAEIEYLYVSMTTWSSMEPRNGYSWAPNQQFRIEEEIVIDLTNRSRNLRIGITLPYTTIGVVLFGLGEFVVLAVIMLLLLGFIISFRRYLRYSDLRHRLSDSRIVPLFMLSVGIFFPWTVQLPQLTNLSYDGASWITWYSIPFMIRWSDISAIQVLLSLPDWWYASWSFIIFLFIPLCYGFLSLSTIETEEFDRTFALALFLPYLAVLEGFNLSAQNLGIMTLGPIIILAALPVWLLRLGLRNAGLTT